MNRSLPLATLLALSNFCHAADWPSFRGPHQDGSSPEKGLPTKFSKTEGVKWAAPLPGLSASIPIVSGGKVFLTAPVEAQKQLVGLCYDAKTGKELWRKVIFEGGLQWDNKSNLASPSAAVDGQRVVFLFANALVACFDYEGRELWKRDIKETHGAFATQWTYGSSPVLDGGKLYIQVLQRNEVWDFQGVQKGTPGKDLSSYLLALDPATGQDLWKVVRPSEALSESLESFSTPIFIDYGGARQMLVTGGNCLTGHDAATGKELWRWGNWNPDQDKNMRLVPCAVAGDGVAVVCSPKNRPTFGVKLGLSGNLDDSALAWTSDPKVVTSDVSTPAYADGSFYVLDSNRKILSRVEPKSGKVLWTGETGSKSKFESSPTVADGKVYAINFWGDVYVMAAGGEKFELLSINEMGDGTKPNGDAKSCRSSIAAADGCLFIRTQDKLYCVGKN
ncbi:MAG: PQQ-binding-like beta-propeller repeat protein [Roseimicrobium sp.]